MNSVRKFEFVNLKGEYSVIETPSDTNPKSIPVGDGKFCRTWIGTSGSYKVSRLKVSTSPYINTMCVKGGFIKIKNKDYVV